MNRVLKIGGWVVVLYLLVTTLVIGFILAVEGLPPHWWMILNPALLSVTGFFTALLLVIYWVS
jgi:ABC-type multidrug transport system permease subunit